MSVTPKHDEHVELETFMTSVASMVGHELHPDLTTTVNISLILSRIRDGYISSGKDPGMSKMLGLYRDCLKVLEAKGRDYTIGSSDRLANFRTAGDFAGVRPLQAWLVYFWKHISAVFNYVKSGGQSESEPIRGRFIDAINYMLLGYLLVTEKELIAEHFDKGGVSDEELRKMVSNPGDGKDDRI